MENVIAVAFGDTEQAHKVTMQNRHRVGDLRLEVVHRLVP